MISLLNSIVGEKVGELHELGFPAFQLSEKVEDCMDAISEEKLYAPTQQKSLCNGSLTGLPFLIIFLGVLFMRD